MLAAPLQGGATTLADHLVRTSGISVQRCYQCGKCSAGCPAADHMDLTPSVVLRLLQTRTAEAERKVLGSYAIWLCLACQTCVARCPMEVDLPKAMDVLRAESLRLNLVHPRARDIVAFHTSFLNTIKRFGRLWEIGLIAEYKVRTLHLWQDVVLAPVMLMKGKLSLIPSFHRKLVSQVFSAGQRKKEHAA
ncbi:MAG TPA: 4Fe-4S dicluster domain-containing protein [Bacteroidota bacterium]|nr:4Fe-4S dicluster domain-containing protein [Bacteroidota bacterium]